MINFMVYTISFMFQIIYSMLKMINSIGCLMINSMVKIVNSLNCKDN